MGRIYFSAVLLGFALPVFALAQTAPTTGASITATPATASVGDTISVAFTSGAPSDDFLGTITMLNTQNDTTIVRVNMYGASGSYPARYPGTYIFNYYLIGSVTPLATSNLVTIAPASSSASTTTSYPTPATYPTPYATPYATPYPTPTTYPTPTSYPTPTTYTYPTPTTNPSGYSVSAAPLEAEVNQPITVAYSAASSNRSIFNTIAAVNESGRTVSTQYVGTSGSGTKTFRIATPGTYVFKYRMNALSGSSVLATSQPVTVSRVTFSRVANVPITGDGPIIAFGDSITLGRDATAGNDYVSLLSALLGEGVVNAGESRDTTGDALARLDQDVLSHNPRLVIVFLGGNDLLQHADMNTTVANMEEIVARIEASGAAVLVVGLNHTLLPGEDTAYRQIAFDLGAAYAPDIMRGILGNPFYTTDSVHPRNNGHQLIANRLEPYLRDLLEQ